MIKKVFAGFALAVVLAGSAGAQIISQWNFDPNPPADLTDSATITGIAASIGTGTASGVHASALTDWTTPAGNGTSDSLSATNWGVGDYFQFTLSTTGFSGIYVAWSQTGSNTGPRDFKLSYSLDGTSFVDVKSYSITNDGWNGTTSYKAASLYSADLSSISELNNAATVYFRVIDTSTTGIGGSAVATGGTGRIDQFTVSQGFVDITVTPVPEPHEYALAVAGLLGLVIIMRRRKAAQVF
ncbi:MAG TPA: hypothetical protein VIM61_02175 [Chthoniobacterales bacterium]